jgi:hypothetical protein
MEGAICVETAGRETAIGKNGAAHLVWPTRSREQLAVMRAGEQAQGQRGELSDGPPHRRSRRFGCGPWQSRSESLEASRRLRWGAGTEGVADASTGRGTATRHMAAVASVPGRRGGSATPTVFMSPPPAGGSGAPLD